MARVKNMLVCVTGAAGFIGAHIVERLLSRGARVRAAVRDVNKAELRFLRGLPGAGDRLELVAADLLNASSYDSAVAGCSYVIHAASPYILDAKDPERDLVEPAVRGTENVLAACAKSPSVQRVVVTSSMPQP